MRTQKQIIILIVVTASLTSFLAVYLLTQTNRGTSTLVDEQRAALIDRFDGVPSDATPTPLAPGIYKASSGDSLAAVNSPDGDNVLYYHPGTGYVSSLDLETRHDTLISTVELAGLTRVIWSPDKNRVLTLSRQGSGQAYRYFDYTTRENGALGSAITDAVFSPDSDRIVMAWGTGPENLIAIADFDGKNQRALLKTRLTNIKLFWPSAETLAFIADDAESGSVSMYLLVNNGDLTEILSSLDNLSVRFSPDGRKLLYVSRNGGEMVARVLDIPTLTTTGLSVAIPDARHCAWTLNNASLVCSLADQGETTIHAIDPVRNTDTDTLSGLAVTPQDVFLSHLEDFLVIINANDQSIWAAKLPN